MTDPDRQIWDGMLAHLRAQHPLICRQWFDELVPLGLANGAIQLRTSTPLHRDYLRRVCADAFNDAARTATGMLVSVRFLGPDEEAARPTPQKRTHPPTPRSPADSGSPAVPARRATSVRVGGPSEPQSLEPAAPTEPEIKPLPARRPDSYQYESLVVDPDYCFENFVVGPENRYAHAAAVAVSGTPGRVYNPLFIHGGVGLGKTHLLQAICLKMVSDNPRTVLYYTSCEGFVTQYFESVQAGTMAEFRHRFRDVDVLVIDDIHFLTKRERSQEEFFHTFNSLHQARKQLILSSDAPPEDIPDLEDRLVSRFKWGLVAKIDAPCFETRVAILKTKAKSRGLGMPDDVACYIAEKVTSNIRELEGALVMLQMRSNTEKRPIDLELARAAVGEPPPKVDGEPTIQTIIGAVTDFYSIRLADLQSKHRQRSVALPRQICMYLARRCTRLSLEEIGGFFGGRDHTTVIHAIRKVEAQRHDSEFDLVVRSLEDKVRGIKPS